MNDDFDPETSQKCNFAATYLSPGKEDQEKERKVEQEAEKEEEAGVKEWAKDKESKKNEKIATRSALLNKCSISTICV